MIRHVTFGYLISWWALVWVGDNATLFSGWAYITWLNFNLKCTYLGINFQFFRRLFPDSYTERAPPLPLPGLTPRAIRRWAPPRLTRVFDPQACSKIYPHLQLPSDVTGLTLAARRLDFSLSFQLWIIADGWGTSPVRGSHFCHHDAVAMYRVGQKTRTVFRSS